MRRRPRLADRPDRLANPLVAALIALPPAVIALANGLPATVDGVLHVHRALSVAYLFSAAPGWPRWAPHFVQGWGYPIHHFYPPGAPLAAAALIAAGAGPHAAHVALIAAAWALAAAGTYRLARTALPASAALLAAGVAAFSPVRLFEVHVQGNVPQLLAVALVPWALAGAVAAARAPTVATAVRFGVPLALIALTHHVTTVLVLPLVGVLAVIECLMPLGTPSPVRTGPSATTLRRIPPPGPSPSTRAGGHLARSALAVTGGLAIAAFLGAVYWLPAVVDASRVQLDKAGSGMFDASTSLVPVLDLVRPLGRIDRTAHSWPFHHGWGTVPALLALAGLAAVTTTRRRRSTDVRRIVGFTAIGVGATLLTLPFAAPLWRSSELIGLVQFPWRVLAVAEPLLAVAAGAALLWLPARRRAAGLAIGLTVLGMNALPWLVPIRAAAPLADATARAAVRAERQSDAPVGTTSSMEYLPHGAKVDLAAPPSDAALAAYAEGRWWVDVDRARLPAGLTAVTEPVGRHDSRIVVGPGPAAVLRLRQLGFPGWRTTVDGRAVRNERDADDDGALVVSLPASAEERHVVARFTGTALARGAGVVSMIAWLVALAVGIAPFVRRRATPPGDGGGGTDGGRGPDGDDLSARARVALAVGLVAAGAAGAVVLPRSTILAPRSPVASPASMDEPLHVALGDGAGAPAIELLGFDAPDVIRAGGTLDVRLFWRALRPTDKRYRPFVQLVTKGTAGVVANHTSTDPGGRPTRTWPTDRFIVDAHRLTLPPDAGPITARLIAGLFDDDTGRRLTAVDGSDIVTLREVRIDPRRRLGPTVLPVAHDDGDNGPAAARLPLHFGDLVVLESADAGRVTGPAGARAIEVTLVWRAAGPIGFDATVFRHVLDASGAPIAQLDGPPAAGDAPTGDWRRGDIIVDRVTIHLPDGAAVAEHVELGLYTPVDGARLPATGADGRLPSDAVRIPVASGP